MSIVVGLSVGHDGGAAVCIDGELCIAVAEERLVRVKHARGWHHALISALSHCNLSLQDIDLFVLSCPGDSQVLKTWNFGLATLGIDRSRLAWCDHHLSHALLSYASSGFARALVVVWDALGNNSQTESYFIVDSSTFEKVGGNSQDRERSGGIGPTYEAFSNLLGLRDDECGKTMALAAFGDHSKYPLELFSVREGRVFGALDQTHQWGARHFLAQNGVQLCSEVLHSHDEMAKDLAALVQHESERAMVEVIRDLTSLTGETAVCIGGGVGLNCVGNGRLRSSLSDLSFHFPGAVDDSGQAAGNALYGTYLLDHCIPNASASCPYVGPIWNEDHISWAIKRHPMVTPYSKRHIKQFWVEKQRNVTTTAAQLLHDGHVLGWWQGRSELGPRALGNRSILATPQSTHAATRVSREIKKREWYRPLAPVVSESEADRLAVHWNRYMTEAQFPSAPSCRRIPGGVHVDGSSRIQVASAEWNPRLVDLLQEFGQKSGVEAVLNTSFNVQEPIVESPGDALLTFLSSDLDYLVLGDWLVGAVSPRGK